MVRLLNSVSVFVLVADIAEGKSVLGVYLLALSLREGRVDGLF